MTQLSPAQAVMNAAGRRYAVDGSLQASIAAGITKLADQVTPANGSRRNNEIRAELLRVAAELEGADG